MNIKGVSFLSFFFSECLISTGFPLFHLFNEVWCPLFPFETDINIRSNSPKFSVDIPVSRKDKCYPLYIQNITLVEIRT